MTHRRRFEAMRIKLISQDPCRLFPRLAFFLLPLSIAGCSLFSGSDPDSVPILFDPSYSIQIEGFTSPSEFPFAEGDIVDFEGMLIYHGPAPQSVRDLLLSAAWFASLYPYGEWTGADSLHIHLQNKAGSVTHELDWFVDNDDVLLVTSASPAPAMLAPNPNETNTTEVCAYLRIDDLAWVEDVEATTLQLTLVPDGTLEDGLIRSEVHLCT